MLTVQDMLLFVFGVIACFAGYSMFREMLPLWGFMLSGWLAFTLMPGILPDLGDQMIFRIVAFVVGGAIGSLLAKPLYYLVVFFSGAALGMMLGVMAGTVVQVGGFFTPQQVSTLMHTSFPPYPHSGVQFLGLVLGGLVLGGIAVSFQRFMIIASSSFVGSAALISGLTGTVSLAMVNVVGKGAIFLMAWILIGIIGMILQFRMSGDV